MPDDKLYNYVSGISIAISNGGERMGRKKVTLAETLDRSAELSPEEAGASEARANAVFAEKLQQMMAETNGGLSTAKAAAELHVTEPYFCYLVKKRTGHTFGELLTEYRMKKAYRMLLDTDYPIKHIAKALNFSNESYFDKVFHKYFGCTPNAVRKDIK